MGVRLDVLAAPLAPDLTPCYPAQEGSPMKRHAYYTASLTAQTSTSETALQIGPNETVADAACFRGAITKFRAYKVSGTGTTVAPIIGYATDPGGAGIAQRILEVAAAADVDEALLPPIPFRCDTTGKLYLRPVCDSGVNNVVFVEIHYNAEY